MEFINLFAFIVALTSNGVNTTITAYANVDINNVEYLEYEYEYEENKTITINIIDSIDIDISLNTYNISTNSNDYSYNTDGDVVGYVLDLNENGFINALNDFKLGYYEEFEEYILEKRILSNDWFYEYFNLFEFDFSGNSYSIVPIANESNNSGYNIIADIYMELYFNFSDNFTYSIVKEEYEVFDFVSENGLNVGMSFSVKNEVLGAYVFTGNDSPNVYIDYIYNRGNENGLFQGRQEGFQTGYNDAIMSQPSSVLELVTKPFVEMGKFLNISIAPNLTLGMIIAIPIIIAVVGFLIKALIA